MRTFVAAALSDYAWIKHFVSSSTELDLENEGITAGVQSANYRGPYALIMLT